MFAIPINLNDLIAGAKQFAADQQAAANGQAPAPGPEQAKVALADLYAHEQAAAKLEAAAAGCSCGECAVTRYAKRLEHLLARMLFIPPAKPKTP